MKFFTRGNMFWSGVTATLDIDEEYSSSAKPWKGRIEIHGRSVSEAEDLGSKILACLNDTEYRSDKDSINLKENDIWLVKLHNAIRLSRERIMEVYEHAVLLGPESPFSRNPSRYYKISDIEFVQKVGHQV